MISLDSSAEDILAEMGRIRELYTLKHTMRYRSMRDHSVHSESVAEHLFGMQILAQYFLPLEDPAGALDRVRINELILYHEIGEIETGDIIFHKKNSDHRDEEKRAAQRVAAKLPASLSAQALERSREFDADETPEAHFAQALDKLEPIFEMFSDLGVPLFRKQEINFSQALGVKLSASEDYPYMRRFLNVWTDWMVSQNAFAE